MKSAKQQAIELIERLPDDVGMEVILGELEFVQTIQERLADLDNGVPTVPHEEVVKMVAECAVRFQSGRNVEDGEAIEQTDKNREATRLGAYQPAAGHFDRDDHD
jgi:hypothetical protein